MILTFKILIGVYLSMVGYSCMTSTLLFYNTWRSKDMLVEIEKIISQNNSIHGKRDNETSGGQSPHSPLLSAQDKCDGVSGY